jgi:HPt (histidine-containing phosphotransfer) domain-containing protein
MAEPLPPHQTSPLPLDSATALAFLQIDWEHLHRISDHSPSFEQDLVSLFAKDMAEQRVALYHAVHQGNEQRVRALAHYMKGAAANLGMLRLVAIASGLEAQASQETGKVNSTDSERGIMDSAKVQALLMQLETALQALAVLVNSEIFRLEAPLSE